MAASSSSFPPYRMPRPDGTDNGRIRRIRATELAQTAALQPSQGRDPLVLDSNDDVIDDRSGQRHQPNKGVGSIDRLTDRQTEWLTD